MYAEQPGSVVVLPPVNTSTLPEASDYYLATIAEPLTATGYTVLPAATVRNIMEQEKLSDTESLYSLPQETLAKYFNADAVLYARLKQWDVTRTSLLYRLIISIETELVSTKTSEQLWRYNTSINIDLNTVKSTGGSVLSLLEGAKEEDVDKATAEAIAYALKLNTKLVRDLPFGPEHESYLQDQNTELIGTIPEKSILKQSTQTK